MPDAPCLRAIIILMLAACGLAAATGSASAVTLGAIPDHTWQANGRVTSVIRVNGVVYIGGEFTQVMDPTGGQPTARNRLAAFDAHTGALLPWNPDASNAVRTLATSQDGSEIFVGGEFTQVGGKPRAHVAEVQAATVGAGTGVVTGWSAAADAQVWGMAVLSGRLYIGGDFRRVDGQERLRLAALSTQSGALSKTWVPRANGAVRVIALSPAGDRLFVGGAFTLFNRRPQPHLVTVTTTGGALLPWASHPGGTVKSFAANATSLFEGDAGGGGHVRAYALGSGKLKWTNTGNGDVERIAAYQGSLLVAGHFTTFGAFAARHLVALNQTTGKVDPSWRPSADSIHGVFGLSAYGQDVYAGGDFTRWFPGSVAQAHFAQFSTGVIDTTAPRITALPKLIVPLGANLGPKLVPTRVSYAASDSGVSGICRYALQKSFAGGPYTALSLPWISAPFAKPGVTPSPDAYRFQVRATDCSDNESAFVPGPPTVLTAFQDGSRSIRYSGRWSGARVADSYGGSIRSTSTPGASASLRFRGRELVWVASRASNRGVARVYIDGRLVRSLNLQARGVAHRRGVFTRAWASDGVHSVKLVCAASAGHPIIDLDAFLTVR